ncbi:MAG: hypothetical protein QOJ07_1422, partial [Thermoleophilaceae bacterium]|nr:hypothetical protein [Thermoleophilaceae bacterium]
MGLGGYLVGALVFAGTWGASAATAALLVRRQLPRLGGVPRVLAFAVLFLAALIAAHLVPGVLGLLSRWSALAVALIGLAAATRFVPRAPGAPNDDTPPAARDSGPVSWALAALAVAALSVYLVAQAWIVSRTPVVGTDALSFELPVIGGWIRSGSLWGIHQFVPLQAQADYPHNGNVVYLAAMQPFRSDFLVRLVSIPFVGLAGLSVYAIGRELRAPRATAALAGVLFAALPAVASTSYYGGKADTITLAAFGTGSLFALRHVRLGRRADLIVAGIGLGLALGAKWYGVPATLVVVGAWAVASLVQRRGVGVVVRGVLALAGLMAAAGGFWFARNAVGSGSPAFPVAVPLFGSTPHDFVRDCVGFSIAHYAGKPGVLKDYAWPGWKLALGLGGG